MELIQGYETQSEKLAQDASLHAAAVDAKKKQSWDRTVEKDKNAKTQKLEQLTEVLFPLGLSFDAEGQNCDSVKDQLKGLLQEQMAHRRILQSAELVAKDRKGARERMSLIEEQQAIYEQRVKEFKEALAMLGQRQQALVTDVVDKRAGTVWLLQSTDA